MKELTLFYLFVIILLFTGCTNDDFGPVASSTDFEYLIFGHFHGECFGEECIETFKLTSDQLFEDTTDVYGGLGPFNFMELEEDRFQVAKDLVNYFPSQLLISRFETFGCPDCSDQGGLFINYSKGEEEDSWWIDRNKDQVPEYLHEFIDAVDKKIELINN